MLHLACRKNGNLFPKNRFCGLQNARVIHPFVLFSLEVHYGMLFSLHAGKGKYCMWPFKKRGNLFFNIKFCGLQMVQFECSRVMRPLLSFTFGSHLGAPFFLHSGYYSEVNDSKECITLGHSKRTIWSPQNLFYTRIFHFYRRRSRKVIMW